MLVYQRVHRPYIGLIWALYVVDTSNELVPESWPLKTACLDMLMIVDGCQRFVSLERSR